MKTSLTKQFVQPSAKGQVTIPANFRKKLSIGPGKILKVTLKKNRIEITPLSISEYEKEEWEPVIDFTSFLPRGIALNELEKRLY